MTVRALERARHELQKKSAPSGGGTEKETLLFNGSTALLIRRWEIDATYVDEC